MSNVWSIHMYRALSIPFSLYQKSKIMFLKCIMCVSKCIIFFMHYVLKAKMPDHICARTHNRFSSPYNVRSKQICLIICVRARTTDSLKAKICLSVGRSVSRSILCVIIVMLLHVCSITMWLVIFTFFVPSQCLVWASEWGACISKDLVWASEARAFHNIMLWASWVVA